LISSGFTIFSVRFCDQIDALLAREKGESKAAVLSTARPCPEFSWNK